MNSQRKRLFTGYPLKERENEKMSTYNDIGIDSRLDWKRIAKLFRIGLFAGILVLIGDMLLGWGVPDESLSGMEKELSAYLTLSDTRIFWSAFLGLIGIPLEGLCKGHDTISKVVLDILFACWNAWNYAVEAGR